MSSMIERAINLPTPNTVDNFGTKWWLDASASDYASRADNAGIRFNAKVWLIEELNGDQKFVLVANEKVIFECHGLAAMGEEIDRIKNKAKYGVVANATYGVSK